MAQLPGITEIRERTTAGPAAMAQGAHFAAVAKQAAAAWAEAWLFFFFCRLAWRGLHRSLLRRLLLGCHRRGSQVIVRVRFCRSRADRNLRYLSQGAGRTQAPRRDNEGERTFHDRNSR